MINKENEPDNLGGLGDMLPVEVLKKLNELLELMHQTDFKQHGSVVFNIYEKGSLHVDHVDNQTFNGDACPKSRKTSKEDESLATVRFDPDTPLSALFRESHHKELRQIIDSWRPYLVDDDPAIDALALSNFQFDLEQTRPVCIYMDLARLINHDALSAPMSVLAAYLFLHSNLSCSENALYVQLKRYKKMCK